MPGLLVLLAAKRTDINDNYKNKRQQHKEQASLTWLVYCALISKCEFFAYSFQLSPFPRGTRQLAVGRGMIAASLSATDYLFDANISAMVISKKHRQQKE